MEGKKKDKYCFVSYMHKKEGELLKGERGQGLNVISMNISKIWYKQYENETYSF